MKLFSSRLLAGLFAATVWFVALVVAPTDANAGYGSGEWGGPVSAPRKTGAPVATAHVLIVGDSIVNGCSGQLVKAFGAKGLKLAVIAQSGQNTKGLAGLLEAEPVLPGRVIMAAGSNDIFNPPAVGPQIARVKAHTAAKGSSLQWADTYVARTTVSLAMRAHDLKNSTTINQQIYKALPGMVISPKTALLRAVERGRSTRYYLRDGLHYWTAAGTGHGDGCAFYAATIAAGVKGQ